MATEIVKCHPVHLMDGVEPFINETNFVVQHPDLIGKPCDCGKLLYDEGKCDTCMGERWRIIWRENSAG